MKQVRMPYHIDDKLEQIKDKRVAKNSFIKTKQDIVSELIEKCFKREVKK